jgi:hypothetical protein
VISNIFGIKVTAGNMPALQKEKMRNMKIKARRERKSGSRERVRTMSLNNARHGEIKRKQNESETHATFFSSSVLTLVYSSSYFFFSFFSSPFSYTNYLPFILVLVASLLLFLAVCCNCAFVV